MKKLVPDEPLRADQVKRLVTLLTDRQAALDANGGTAGPAFRRVNNLLEAAWRNSSLNELTEAKRQYEARH